MSRTYDEAQLPYFPIPVISVRRQEMVEFREAYRELQEFAAAICGKPAKELRAVDTIAKLMEVCPPDKMTPEQLKYWSRRPSMMAWAMLVSMAGDGE